MEHPQSYPPAARYNEKLHSMQPVYGLTAGLTNNAIIKAVRQALESNSIPEDFLPEELETAYDFPPCEAALYEMHFPHSKETLLKQEDALSLKNFSPLSFHCDM